MKAKVRKTGGKTKKTGRIVQPISINGDFIRLDALLKFAAIALSGGEAKLYIQENEVTVNGDVCIQRGRKIRPGDTVCFRETVLTIISADKENSNDSKINRA
jgi:ribosome-associated protein